MRGGRPHRAAPTGGVLGRERTQNARPYKAFNEGAASLWDTLPEYEPEARADVGIGPYKACTFYRLAKRVDGLRRGAGRRERRPLQSAAENLSVYGWNAEDSVPYRGGKPCAAVTHTGAPIQIIQSEPAE